MLIQVQRCDVARMKVVYEQGILEHFCHGHHLRENPRRGASLMTILLAAPPIWRVSWNGLCHYRIQQWGCEIHAAWYLCAWLKTGTQCNRLKIIKCTIQIKCYRNLKIDLLYDDLFPEKQQYRPRVCNLLHTMPKGGVETCVVPTVSNHEKQGNGISWFYLFIFFHHFMVNYGVGFLL